MCINMTVVNEEEVIGRLEVQTLLGETHIHGISLKVAREVCEEYNGVFVITPYKCIYL